MFDDILIKDPKPNRKVVCPSCGAVILTIETEFDSEDYDIENWDYECKQCVDKTLHCTGGCGKTAETNLLKVNGAELIKWTCAECCNKEWDKYD